MVKCYCKRPALTQRVQQMVDGKCNNKPKASPQNKAKQFKSNYTYCTCFFHAGQQAKAIGRLLI